MKLKFRETLGYGIGAVGKDMVYALVATFLLIYFEDTLGINALFIGTLFMAARIFDAFNDPIMGIIVDKTRTRFGKFRPWILIGTIINAFVLFFMFAVPKELSGTALLTYVSIAYILWGVTYTIMDIPFWSMIPALTNDGKEREKISVVGRSCAGLGFAIISSLTLVLVGIFGNGDDYQGFKIVALVVAIFFVVASSIMVLNVKEHVAPESKTSPSIKEMFSSLFSNDQALIVVLAIVIFNSSLYLTQTLAVYFFKYDIGNADLFGLFALIGGATQILAMVLLPILRKALSRRQIFIGAITTAIIGYSFLFALGTFGINNVIFLCFAAIIIFAGFGLCTVLTTVFLADSVDYGEWKTHQRNESVIFSMQTFVVKFASAISAFLAGVALTIIKLDKNAEIQSASTLFGLRVFMIILPIAGLLISMFIFMKKYKLNERFLDKILKEKDNRKKITM